jgi:GNAT superfamily N-acetyltransferase
VTPEVRRIGADDWEALRDVRLAALADAPYAFGATVEEERTLTESNWRARADAHAWFLAFDGARAVGVAAGAQLREPDPSTRMLRAMWVEPSLRGSGLAAELVARVAGWARADGARVLALWATQRAARARAFYERLGFAPTGDERPMPAKDHPLMARYDLSL